MKSVSEVPLLDVAEGIFDGPHATPPESQDGPIFLRLDNITPEGRLDLTDLRYINQSDFPRWTRRITPLPGDVVFSYEATLHRYVVIPEGFHGCLGRRLALIRPNRKKIEPRFLHYYLLSPRWRSVAGSAVINGATVDRISLTLVRNLPVRLPSLEQQRSIVEVLSAYDDLIENNRRRMALLEESARLLYQEWFVRLRFPGHEHVRIVDGVPDDWERKTLIEVSGSLEDGDWIESKDQSGEDYRLLQISNIGMNDFIETENYRFISEETFRRLNCREVKAGDLLISRMPKPIGRAWLVTQMPWRMITAVDAAILTTDDLIADRYFLLYHLNSPSSIEHCERRATGSTRPRIARRELAGIPVLLPPVSLQQEFREIVEPINEQRSNLYRQNQKLRLARDLLLPRLMSGEITA